jgi:DMSO/TMAO reductase YedYZ molybdopterin-dependent catalytic subunit
MKKNRKKLSWDRLRGIAEDNGATPRDMDRLDVVHSRRKFFGQAGVLAAIATLGPGVDTIVRGVFGRGLIPVAWAQEAETSEAATQNIAGKPGLIVHTTKPINGEFAPHLLDEDVTPNERHFVRNNGQVPQRAQNQDPQGWTLTIDGEVQRPLKLTLDDLQRMPAVSMPLLIECAGNGRSFFQPETRGTPWRYGAIGCSEWTGVRLRDVLRQAGLKDSAVHTGHYGEDPPLSGTEVPISRGIPIDKAMEEHTIIAYRMNGKPIAPLNGYPVRLVVPGWIGSASQKWLTRIWVRNQIHDGPKMTGYSYRTPAYPVVPGSKPPEEDMVILTSWLVKSMITSPQESSHLKAKQSFTVRGHAWAGESRVDKVMVSTDYGMTWRDAKLRNPPNKYAWYGWETRLSFPGKGYYEIWARAFDNRGNAQPFAAAPWNPRGYMANQVHRLPVLVDL